MRLVTAEELFVPTADGTPPFARLLLDQVTSVYPIDEDGEVFHGPAPLDRLAQQKGRGAHPYVFIQQVFPAEGVVCVERKGKEYYVGRNEQYLVTVSSNPRVASEVAEQNLTRHESHYSKATGWVTILKPRPVREKQTYFPDGMSRITSIDSVQ